MKKLFIIICVIATASCTNDATITFKKPFTIITKEIYSDGSWYYRYQDANGNKNSFRDSQNAYHIGDTIK